MKCKKCGEELPERARFCPECGTPVEEVPAPKKLEKPLEPMGFGAVPLVPIAPPPRATRITPRVPRQYGAARAGRSTTRIPLSAYPTFKSETPEPAVEPEVAAAAEPVVEAEVREPEAVETPAEPVAEPVAEPEPQAEKNDEPEAVVEEAPEAEKDEAPEVEAEPAAEVAAEPEAVAEPEVESAEEPEAVAEPEPEPTHEPAPEPEPADEPEFEATQAMVFESDADSEPLPAGSEPASAPEEPGEPEPSLADRARTALGSVADRVRGILPQSNDQRALIGIVALAAVIAVAFLVYVSVGWFSPFADRSYVAPEVQPPSDGSIAPLEADDQEEEEPTFSVEGGPEVRSALVDYSWTELSQISALISAAESDEEGVKIASYYNLCDETGAIDAEATKPLELADGTSVPIAVAGFRHDTRSDGSGLAGISFVARGSVGSQPMNALAQTAGGWEASTLRAWVNEGLLAQLPAELADLLVAVDKTNNPVPGSGGGQTVTSDRVWLLAYSEIVGELGEGSWLYGSYQNEGAQYKIFSDLGVTWGESFPQVALSSGEYWWERSPSPNNSAWFMCVSPEGEMGYGHRPATPDAVVIGFCL